MLVLWRTDTALHRDMRGGEQEIYQLTFMERACPEAFLAVSSLVRACGPCCVDLLVNHDVEARLPEDVRVPGLQLIDLCTD